MITIACTIIKVLCGHIVAMHWHYINVDLTLIRHFSFSLGPLAALQTLLERFTVVLSAIGLSAAPAPRELGCCNCEGD